MDAMPRPLGDRVLIKVLDEQHGVLQPVPAFGTCMLVTEEGTEEPKPRPARGIIVATGPGTMFMRAEEEGPERAYMPVCVDVGDEVLFISDVGLSCEVNGEELLLVCENAILVVMSSIEHPLAFDPE